jgi:hypothetical protein
MILLQSLCNAADIDYTVAIDAAKRAAMIQTGAQSYQDKFSSYAQDRANTIVTKAGLTVPVGIIYGSYWLYKNRKIPLHYSKVKLDIYEDHVQGSIGNVSFSASQTSFSGSVELNSLWRIVE